MTSTNNLDKTISNILTELDKEQAEYQLTYKKLYGKPDEQARHIYNLLTKLCERIRKEAQERK
jgi:hypothetical protein